MKSGDFQTGLGDCNRSLELSAEDAPAYDSRAHVSNKLNNLEAAKKHNRKALALSPELQSIGRRSGAGSRASRAHLNSYPAAVK